MSKESSAQATNKFDVLVGMSREDYKSYVTVQTKHLPPSQVIPTHAIITRRLGELLRLGELKRVAGSKKIPLWPVAWVRIPMDKTTDAGEPTYQWQATDVPLTMFRISKPTKKGRDPITDLVTEIPHPNYGRFYVARHVPRLLPTGEQEMTDSGYPATDMVDFRWMDQTDFAMSGALALVAPGLETLLVSRGIDPSVDTLWPQELLNMLFLRGKTDKEMLAELKAHIDLEIEE